MAAQVARHAPPVKDHQPVVLFNASTRLEGLSLNAAYAMLTGWSIRLVGTPVIHWGCQAGLRPCVLGTNQRVPSSSPPCPRCIAQSNTIYKGAPVHWFTFQVETELQAALSRLTLEELSLFCYEDLPLGELVLPSLRWILRRHHLQDDEHTRFLYKQYILSAYSMSRQFRHLLAEVQPKAVMVFNGMFYPEAVVRWLSQTSGIRVISHEVGLRPFTGFFTQGEATAYPIAIPPEFELSEQQEARLDCYLEERFQGNFSMAGIRFWPEMHNLGEDFWRRATSFKQVVPVFTNVIFDTSQGHANVTFPHMFAWLDLVLEIIKRHPETLFVIRAHPDEMRLGKESQESVADWAQNRQVEALSNVLLVASQEYFSSYELIQRSKFVMVYNSTIGLEASVLGVPVLCGGKARFTQISTVFFPVTPDEYRLKAEEFLSIEHIRVPDEYRRNARRFLYYQLFCSSLSFENYLQEDRIWRGYVALKPFDWQQLLPENSPTLRVILDGLLCGKSFDEEG